MVARLWFTIAPETAWRADAALAPGTRLPEVRSSTLQPILNTRAVSRSVRLLLLLLLLLWWWWWWLTLLLGHRGWFGLQVSGAVLAEDVGGRLRLTYNLDGLESSAQGGLHVHTGTTCNAGAAAVGGHLYAASAADDPANVLKVSEGTVRRPLHICTHPELSLALRVFFALMRRLRNDNSPLVSKQKLDDWQNVVGKKKKTTPRCRLPVRPLTISKPRFNALKGASSWHGVLSPQSNRTRPPARSLASAGVQRSASVVCPRWRPQLRVPRPHGGRSVRKQPRHCRRRVPAMQ